MVARVPPVQGAGRLTFTPRAMAGRARRHPRARGRAAPAWRWRRRTGQERVGRECRRGADGGAGVVLGPGVRTKIGGGTGRGTGRGSGRGTGRGTGRGARNGRGSGRGRESRGGRRQAALLPLRGDSGSLPVMLARSFGRRRPPETSSQLAECARASPGTWPCLVGHSASPPGTVAQDETNVSSKHRGQ